MPDPHQGKIGTFTDLAGATSLKALEGVRIVNHSPIEIVTVRYADFIRVCHVQDPADFAGFRVETDGLYTILPDRDVPLTHEERATLSWHPTGHFDQPALPFPCTVAQLKTFVDDAGLAGCIDETTLAELTGVTGVATEIARARDSDATPVVELELVPMPEAYTSSGVPDTRPEQVETHPKLSATGDDGTSSTNWRHLVQAEAYEHWLRLRASGCNPSVYSICDDMAKWCVKHGIRGDKNQDPKAGTIRNTVLSGSSGWVPPHQSIDEAKKYIAQIAQTAQTKVARTEN